MSSWDEIAADFRKFHAHPLNVALHLVTTPFAILGCTACAAHFVSPAAVMGFHALWAASLLIKAPMSLVLMSWMLHAVICTAGIYMATAGLLSPIAAFMLFAVSYVAQDGSHVFTCEATYQSSYQGKRDNWVMMLLAHTHLLVPLCFDACWHTVNGSLASLVVQRKQVSFTTLNKDNHPELRTAMEEVGQWSLAQNPRHDATTHWWPHQLDAKAEQAFYTVARSKELMSDLFGSLFPATSHVVEPLEGMNEVYVACKGHKNGNSDTVFYMNHVDGPYGIFPLVHVYRCMAACTPNGQIETIFPLAGGRTHYCLTTGEIVGFDFNRELHRINLVPPERGGIVNDKSRVCMKLHFIIYPKALAPLGKLLGRMTTHYNENFRKLFVSTIDPNSLYSRFMAVNVLLGTMLFNSFESVIGWANIPVLLTYTLAANIARSYTLFFYLTSFTHYAVYMATYHQKTNIAYGAFKRDALLYKTLALTQAVAQYIYYFDYAAPDLVSLGMLAGGFGLASLAASRLGVDRTYFGWELGEIEGHCVLKFPYGVIPHPMILGGCIGWMGFYKLAAFRAAWPLYAPLHVACYLAHAVQEHLDDGPAKKSASSVAMYAMLAVLVAAAAYAATQTGAIETLTALAFPAEEVPLPPAPKKLFGFIKIGAK